MIRFHLLFDRRNALQRLGKALQYATLAALILVTALPARAGDARTIKSRVAPSYPELAKRMHIGGVVILSATVDAQGKVTDVKEVSGNHILAVAAEDAVRQWKFAPASDSSRENVEVNFALGHD